MTRRDPQLNIRLPAELIQRVAADATANNRSTNAEIVHRLDGAGMSLRDWFAGQAMAAHIRNAGEHAHSRPEEYGQCRADTARRAYAIADAMLAERSKP